MTYVYGCVIRDHPRKEVVHSMKENPVIKCDVCGRILHRIPQPFRLNLDAQKILVDWLADNAERHRRKLPLFSPNLVKRYDPIPATQFDTRKEIPKWQKKP